jgi:hypothetical protein
MKLIITCTETVLTPVLAGLKSVGHTNQAVVTSDPHKGHQWYNIEFTTSSSRPDLKRARFWADKLIRLAPDAIIHKAGAIIMD